MLKEVNSSYALASYSHPHFPGEAFCYVDDCVLGIDKIMHCDDIIDTPVNLGSNKIGSINELRTRIKKITCVKMNRHHDLNAPKGVAGRNSDNTFILKVPRWEPNIKLDCDLAQTFAWIYDQYRKRTVGQRVGIGRNRAGPGWIKPAGAAYRGIKKV